MGKYQKIYAAILAGETKNISFEELVTLLLKLGFQERVKGSHHIFYNKDIDEIINIQERESKAKPYQIKQIRIIIIKYKRKLDERL